ncbi:MAG TPA: hypothetical protein VFU35_04305 [Jatrophihabitans sp.]|nr:hypothetical protein [Jatrophihabitans sp.]
MLRGPDAPPLTRGVIIRAIVFAIALSLGAVAVWLISTSTTQKALQLGVLAGLWGLLLGTFSILGNRRQPQPAVTPTTGADLELRAVTALLGALRADVAQLRAELAENAGGQLRLERIETTRLFGADLPAEAWKLKLAAEPGELAHVAPVVEARSPEPRHAAAAIDTAAPEDPGYHGRRRRDDERADPAQDDLLARLLARESVR